MQRKNKHGDGDRGGSSRTPVVPEASTMWLPIDMADDIEELKETLLTAFLQWKNLRCFYFDEKDLEIKDWVKEFCEDVALLMRELEQQGGVGCEPSVPPRVTVVDLE